MWNELNFEIGFSHCKVAIASQNPFRFQRYSQIQHWFGLEEMPNNDKVIVVAQNTRAGKKRM